MFGKDDLRDLREALFACGCDRIAFKSWQRQYERLMKQMPSVREQYERALLTTQEVYVTAQELEKLIVDGGKDACKEFAGMVKSLKKVQNSFDHEFLVSREDKEFHSTYDSVLKLGAKALGDSRQRLILQSEIENLLALLKENLEKEEPQLHALCFFYQEHTNEELFELPPAKRVERIVDVYQREFVAPIARMLSEGIPLADKRCRELEKSGDRRHMREAQQLGFLCRGQDARQDTGERVQEIVRELMDRGEER